MRLRLLSEDVLSHPLDIQEAMLLEMPHGQFRGDASRIGLPIFPGDRIIYDLGFEDLCVAKGYAYKDFTLELGKLGYKVPGTSYKIWSKISAMCSFNLDEASDEPSLPDDWMEFVSIYDNARPEDLSNIVWYGKQVSSRRLPSDPENFEEVEHGFKRIKG